MADHALVASGKAKLAPGCAFWILWVLASTLGWAMGFPVSAVVFGTIGIGGAARSSLAPVVILAVVGGVAGIMQWLLLRRYMLQAARWVPASTLGGALAGIVSDVGIPTVSFAVVGTVVGMAQWFVLRRYVAQAGWWIAASTVSWTVAFPVVETVTSPVLRAVDASVILPLSEMMSEIVDMAALFGVMGGVPEVIRGAVMAWLMQHPVPDPHRHLA